MLNLFTFWARLYTCIQGFNVLKVFFWNKASEIWVGCTQEGPDLATIRDLESEALDKMMRENASRASPTSKTQWTLTRKPWILNRATWCFHYAGLWGGRGIGSCFKHHRLYLFLLDYNNFLNIILFLLKNDSQQLWMFVYIYIGSTYFMSTYFISTPTHMYIPEI